MGRKLPEVFVVGFPVVASPGYHAAAKKVIPNICWGT